MELGACTRKLAEFISTLRFEEIPSPTVEHIKTCMLDTLACGLFGSSLRWSRIVADFVREMGGGEEASVWGRGFKVPAANAALANGTAVHSFEIDDLHKKSILHPGSVVLTSAFAMAERIGGCSGKDFITAIVAGYEAGTRIGMVTGTAHLEKGFHPTGTHGTFAAAAAAGKILNLNPEAMTHALGIAGTQAAGLMAAQYSAMVKRMHAGRAAQSGVYGALLSRSGFTGITNILEADYGGYFKVMGASRNKEEVLDGLGAKYEVDAVGLKPYSAGGSTHTAHEAVKSILERHDLKAHDIETILIRCTTATYNHTSWEYVPEGVTSAQMNMQYVVAVTVFERDLFVEQFTEEKISDPAIIAFSKNVKAVPDKALDELGPDFRHAVKAEVRTKSGSCFTEDVKSATGSFEKPMTAEEIEKKYYILCSKVVEESICDEIFHTVCSIDKNENILKLIPLLTKKEL